MKTLSLVQGTPEWHAHRANHFNASDAPAMMGVSKYTSRTELLRLRSGGEAAEIGGFTQALFDRGHAAEAAVRPKIEELISEDLYPVTGVSDEHPKLSASFDGIDMAEEIGLEVKMLNAALVEQVKAGELTDPHYYTQVEQQILIGKLKKVIFAVSNEDASEFYYMEYFPVPGRAEAIIAGWAQFEADLVAYVHEAPVVEVVGATVASLPALSIQLVGEVKSSNLVAYKANALAFIESINTDLQTDQDFANAEKVVKFCDSTEKELDVVKKQALGQTVSIEELFRTVDELKGALRDKRLLLDKLVKTRKESIRIEIMQAATNAFAAHVAVINKRLGAVALPSIAVSFAEAMKGKKTVASLRDAADTELARGKIAANAEAEKIAANMALIAELIECDGRNYSFLISADTRSLVLKDGESLTAIVKGRIAEYLAKERAQIEAQAEAARENIRREEQAKAQADARAIAERDRTEREAEQRQLEESERAERKATPPIAAEVAPQAHPTTVSPSIFDDQVREIEQAPTPITKPRVKLDTNRPSDEDIIAALGNIFCARPAVVAGWLLTMNQAELAKVAA